MTSTRPHGTRQLAPSRLIGGSGLSPGVMRRTAMNPRWAGKGRQSFT